MTPDNADKIVIIDKDASVLDTFKMLFKYYIYQFTSPQDCFDSMEKIKPDLFIMEWEMGSISGLDVCKKIRSVGTFDLTPICFYTNIAPSEENIKVAYEAGAQLFIPKNLSDSFVEIQITNLIKSSEIRMRYLKNQKIMISELKNSMASKLTGVTTAIEILGMHSVFEDQTLKDEINSITDSSNQLRILFEDLNEIFVSRNIESTSEDNIENTTVNVIVNKATKYITQELKNRDVFFLADGNQKIACNIRSMSRVLFYLSKFIDSLVPLNLPISIEISGNEPTEFSLYVEGNYKNVFIANIEDMNNIQCSLSPTNHFYMHYAQNALYLHDTMFSMIETEGITGIRFAIRKLIIT